MQSSVLLLLSAIALAPSAGCENAKEPLFVHCAAGIKDPVEAAARRHEIETGVPVRLTYGPSQALLLQAEVAKKGDLFLPGDDSYIDLARTKNMVGGTRNPKGIRSIQDLLRSEIRIGQVNPDAGAAGRPPTRASPSSRRSDIFRWRSRAPGNNP